MPKVDALKPTKKIARKILSLVDLGLPKGLGSPEPGKMCVEAVVCYAFGLPHSDKPHCVNPVLKSFSTALNDHHWRTNKARAKGMRRLSIAQLGTNENFDSVYFLYALRKLIISKYVSKALLAAAKLAHKPYDLPLIKAANNCKTLGTVESAQEAKITARDVVYAVHKAGDYVARDSFVEAVNAAAHVASVTHDAAAGYSVAGYADGYADGYAAIYAAVYAVAVYAVAVYAVAVIADSFIHLKDRDKLSDEFAEDVVQILIDMKTPGSKWLDITEE